MKYRTKIKWKLIIFLSALLITSGSVQAQGTWTLQQCVDSALVNNKKLKISKNNILISTEKEREIKSNMIPKVSLNGDYKYYTDLPTQLMPLSVFGGPVGQFQEAQFGVSHNINANIMLTMPLYSPEIFGGINKTKIASEISDLNYQKTEEEINFQVSYYYYNAQIVKSQIQFVKKNLENSSELLRVVELLHEQLLLTSTDVDKVMLQLQQLETNQLIAENKYTQIINGMKILIGVELSQVFSINPEIDLEQSIEYSVKQTIEMKMVDAQYSLLNSDLTTLQRSRYLPSVFLYGSYGTLGYGYTQSPNDFLNFYTVGFVGLKASYPLFNGTTTLKKINQKNLELENNELQKLLLTDQNEVQVENANLQLSIALQLIISSQQQIELAQSVYKQVLLQQKEGMVNITEVLLADSAVHQAQQSYVTAIIDYYKADLELRKLLIISI
jgi:outer membrane protein TolC